MAGEKLFKPQSSNVSFLDQLLTIQFVRDTNMPTRIKIINALLIPHRFPFNQLLTIRFVGDTKTHTPIKTSNALFTDFHSINY